MLERSQKRKLRSDQSTSQLDEEVASSTNDENALLSGRNFEDISNKIENKISKRLRDTELNQREILKLIESLSSKVDNLSNVSSERGCLTDRVVNSGNSADEVEEVDFGRSECSNSRYCGFSLHGAEIFRCVMVAVVMCGWLVDKKILHDTERIQMLFIAPC